MSSANVFAAKPWLALYGSRAAQVQAGFQDMLSLFRAAALSVPEHACIRYFDTTLSYRAIDEQSDALAVWLAAEAHVTQGARVAIVLQNVPEFAIATLAIWKLGAAPMPVNPTYRERELTRLFGDGAPAAVICETSVSETVRAALQLAGQGRLPILTATAGDMRAGHEAGGELEANGARGSVREAIAAHSGRRPPLFTPAPEGMGLLLYTSGTTGDPKGAVLSHRALAFNSQISVDWFGIRPNARVLAIAPLFHITGFQVELCSAWLARGMLLLNYRFDPQLVLDSMLVNRPTFTICTITAYIAMMSCVEASANHFSSFHTLYCGGAPIPPPVLDRFEQRFGRRISSAYGMTESCAPTHVCPEEVRVPVDAELGCSSIGIPVSNVEILIRRSDGCPANSGEAGELLIRGPMLMDGYFNNPQISAETLRDGWLHTGDIACMDGQGWFFLVDRKKDVIICSGFKVWPREVEDVIYGHSSVREAAVVGVPDSYRGETIKAYISLRPGMDLVIDELLQLCRANLAGYKVPRLVEVLPDLPKTATGKIMRVELRKLAARG